MSPLSGLGTWEPYSTAATGAKLQLALLYAFAPSTTRYQNQTFFPRTFKYLPLSPNLEAAVFNSSPTTPICLRSATTPPSRSTPAPAATLIIQKRQHGSGARSPRPKEKGQPDVRQVCRWPRSFYLANVHHRDASGAEPRNDDDTATAILKKKKKPNQLMYVGRTLRTCGPTR